MPTVFLDSSALVKCYVDEPGTESVRERVARGERVCVSRLAQVEVTSVLVRRARRVGVDAAIVAAALGAFESDLRQRYTLIELSAAVVARAVDLTRTHALRAADALQLASALLAPTTDDGADRLLLLSCDQELNAAAQNEGIEVCDPTAPA
ncbi:MAG: hypothetical protein CHACPFDD_01822 [Phycisphaerae bacterium]|nr:hypothetical protein [Phycisphaerae bacterium]